MQRAYEHPSPMLIDEILPEFDTTIVETVVVDADVARTYAATRDQDFMQIHTPLLDAAFWVRALPERINDWRTGERSAEPPPSLRLADPEAGLEGWMNLGEQDGSEIVFGAVGRFWGGEIEWAEIDPTDFTSFDEPDQGKIAASISMRPYGETRTLLSYEARTLTTDPESRRKFLRYWRLVRPFVGYIMRAALRTISASASGGEPRH